MAARQALSQSTRVFQGEPTPKQSRLITDDVPTSWMQATLDSAPDPQRWHRMAAVEIVHRPDLEESRDGGREKRDNTD